VWSLRGRIDPNPGFGQFNFMGDHVSVLLMTIRIMNADIGLLVNQASPLAGPAFAVIATAFPCSAFRFPCSR